MGFKNYRLFGTKKKNRESTEKHEQIFLIDRFFDLSPDLICICSLDGFFEKINSRFEQKLGFSKEEIIGKSYDEFIHPEDTHKAHSYWKGNLNQGTRSQFEVRLLSKGGDEKWFLWCLENSKDTKQVYSVIKDISSQKEKETNLLLEIERLRKSQGMVKLGYWSRNLEKPNVEWSPETYEIFGQEKKNFIPLVSNIEDCCHPEDKPIFRNALSGNFLLNGENSFVHRIITANGQTKWLFHKINRREGDNGVLATIEGIVQDITSLKLVEKELWISNERFGLVIKASNELIWEWDFETNSVFRSNRFEKNISYLSKEKKSKTNSWFSKIYPEDIDGVWTSLEGAINDPSVDYWQMHYRIINRGFEVSYLVDRCVFLRNEKKEIIRAVGAVQDVSSSQKCMETINAQNNKLRRIAWMHSHILRAPLTRIMSLVLDLKEQEYVAANDNYYNNVLEACQEMDSVIRKIAIESEIIKIKD